MSELEEAALRVALQLLGDTLDNDDPELQEALRQLRALVARRYGRVVLQEEGRPQMAGNPAMPGDIVVGLGPIALSGRATGQPASVGG